MGRLTEHPPGSTIRTDEQGSYVAYHRMCKGCQIELTSRNRPLNGSLNCKPCLSMDVSKRWTQAHPMKPKQPPLPAPVQHDHTDQDADMQLDLDVVKKMSRKRRRALTPAMQKVHDLLAQFLLYPTVDTKKDALLDGLVVYEIKERIRFL